MRTALLFCLLGLTSCATMSEQACRTADWRLVGYNDGVRGYPRTRVADHGESCAKTGIRVDETQYFAGREQGLQQYCTPDNAQKLGLAGAGYAQVCPPELAPAFVRRYEAAQRVYRQRLQVDKFSAQIEDLEKRLSKAPGEAERRKLRDELRDADYDLRRAREYLLDLEDALLAERNRR